MFKKLRKFLSAEDGNVMVMSALAVPLMATTAAIGIDVAELYRAKASYQAAVDAAALAAAKIVSRSGDVSAADAYGRSVFEANIENLPNSTGNITFNMGNGDCSTQGVEALATLRHPMFFDKVHKVFTQKGDAGHANMEITSTVQCGSDSVEIALVLDNSGSMSSGGKLTTLKSASRNLINTLHDSLGNAGKPKPVQFSLVPFTGMVNVGDQYRNAAWMDTEGRASYHHEHFDWSTLPGAVQSGGVWRDASGNGLHRFRLYDELGVNWAGCVEQRPHPYHTNDTPPSSSDPDSLIVPSFAPDTPDNWSGEREASYNAGNQPSAYCVQWYWGRWRGYCRRWSDGYWGYRHPVEGYANRYGGQYDNSGRYIGGSSITYGNIISEETYENNYLADEHNMPTAAGHQFDPSHTGTGVEQYSRQRWMWKYFSNPSVSNTSVVGLPGGPNAWCTAPELTPLTTSRNTALNAVNNMIANGTTNVQHGIAWGWKTLSNAEPFTGGRPASATNNKKIMIVMTDGNNTYYPSDIFYGNRSTRNPAYYSSFGHNGGRYDTPLPKRLFEGFDGIANPTDDFDTYRKAMDEHMVETCVNAKNDGIEVYTIAFDVPNGSSVKQKLEQCASTDAAGSPLYFDANNNAALLESFKKIADKIAELSITH